MTARRTDLLLEVSDVIPAGGEYISDWIDSADVLAVRAAWLIAGGGSPQFKIEDSFDGAGVFQTPLSSSSTSSRSNADLTARLFRVHITAGVPGGAFAFVVRAIS